MNLLNSITLIVIYNMCHKTVICGPLDTMVDVKGNNAIKEIRILYQLSHKEDIPQVYSIVRGSPLHAEIDFMPTYIPANTQYVAITVIIPEFTCFGRQYILGFHRERWQMPACRLCTNIDQKYTMPVVLYLGPDSGCYDGRVPTYWKVEAIPYNRPLSDNTDLIIGLVYDKDKQLRICTTDEKEECFNAKNIFVSNTRSGRRR
ncbi:unnamed protein product [Medioppia subpectinata]|uniref:Uncharacterized protein n=1 Tax=Medioppia subpectinata TaxID=1979941 RepID=A0A7R9KDD4_9ACAR|nr:unnamed protein product [Medioppia subpectinata]CAG2100539.1 unnamed protein product [Medioppia subpectinata]